MMPILRSKCLINEIDLHLTGLSASGGVWNISLISINYIILRFAIEDFAVMLLQACVVPLPSHFDIVIAV